MTDQQKLQPNEENGAPEETGEVPAPSSKRNAMLREVFSWVRMIAVAVLLAVLIRSFVFTPVRVDGSSMLTTLYHNELMLVTRFVRYIEPLERGDIVILYPPDLPRTDESFYVKRVIGLPGERVRIEQGVVYINDEALEEPYLTSDWAGDFSEITVPEGEYFVLGDNRGASKDSRMLGCIPKADIQGRAVAVLWPLSDLRTLR